MDTASEKKLDTCLAMIYPEDYEYKEDNLIPPMTGKTYTHLNSPIKYPYEEATMEHISPSFKNHSTNLGIQT